MNSRMMKIVMIAMVAMMATGSVAFAQRGEGNGKGKGRHKGEQGEMIQKVIKRLNLTEAQQAQIKTIRENFKSANAANVEQMKALRTQIKEAQKSGNTALATSLREQMKAKMEAMRPAREQMKAQIMAVLTPEQRAEAEKIMAERKGKVKGQKAERGSKGDRRDGGQAKQKSGARID